MTLYYDACLEFMTGLIKEFAKTNIQAASMMDQDCSDGKLAILSAKRMPHNKVLL